MKIGQTVKFWRNEKGISQTDLSKRSGITEGYLSMIESGKRKPSYRVIESLVKALGVPEPILFWGAIEIEDIQESKRSIFVGMKPYIDSLLKELI